MSTYPASAPILSPRVERVESPLVYNYLFYECAEQGDWGLTFRQRNNGTTAVRGVGFVYQQRAENRIYLSDLKAGESYNR